MTFPSEDGKLAYMKKLFACFLLLSLGGITPAAGQNAGRPTLSPQAIHLNDGTVIKGRLVGVNGDQYIIDSANLGQVRIKTSDLKSLSAGEPNPGTKSLPQPSPSSLNSPQIPPQIQEMGKKMLADPEITSRLMELANDPEIKRLSGDPAILQSALTMDPKQIQEDPKIQQLLSHPKMKELMDLVAKKFFPQQGQGNPLSP